MVENEWTECERKKKRMYDSVKGSRNVGPPELGEMSACQDSTPANKTKHKKVLLPANSRSFGNSEHSTQFPLKSRTLGDLIFAYSSL